MIGKFLISASVISASVVVTLGGAVSAFGSGEFPKSETTTSIFSDRLDESLQWGEAMPDYVQLLYNIDAQAASVAESINGFLSETCEATTKTAELQSACEFIPLLAKYKKISLNLRSLISSRALSFEGKGSEMSLRALNWEFDPFFGGKANLLIDGDPHHKSIETIVEWLVIRQHLARKVDDLSRYFDSIDKKEASLTQGTRLPVLKAYFSSPTLLGKTASFIEQIKCLPKQRECLRAKVHLTQWVVERVQALRPNILNLKNFIENKTGVTPSPEISSLKALYAADMDLQVGDEQRIARYKDLITQATENVGGPSGVLVSARLGVIQLIEILKAYNGQIPEQEPLSATVYHPKLFELQKRINHELGNTVYGLEGYFFEFEREMR